jgi:hypothetical protein
MALGLLEFDKMATKFKMASETYIFLILLSKLLFSTDFKMFGSMIFDISLYKNKFLIFGSP